jgi:hypothetical protein
MITLTDSNEVTWFIMGLDRYIGYIEGLDIGAEAEIKGIAPATSSAAKERFFQPSTLILEDAEYDIGPLSAAQDGAVPRKQASQQENPARPEEVLLQPEPPAALPAQYSQLQPVIIQMPAPQPVKEEQPAPWAHAHKSPWEPAYGMMGKEMDTESFWKNDSPW